jgi:hypothetical protein
MSENTGSTKQVFEEIAVQLKALNATVMAMEAHMGAFGFKGYRIVDLKHTVTHSEAYRKAVARLQALIDAIPSTQ